MGFRSFFKSLMRDHMIRLSHIFLRIIGRRVNRIIIKPFKQTSSSVFRPRQRVLLRFLKIFDNSFLNLGRYYLLANSFCAFYGVLSSTFPTVNKADKANGTALDIFAMVVDSSFRSCSQTANNSIEPDLISPDIAAGFPNVPTSFSRPRAASRRKYRARQFFENQFSIRKKSILGAGLTRRNIFGQTVALLN